MTRRTAGAALVVLALVALIYRQIFEGQVIAARDVFRLFIPDSALLHDYLTRFDWPLWNPWERMGQPFAASMQAQAFYPPRVLTVALFGPVAAMTAMQVLHVLLAIFGVAWLLKPLVRRWYAPWVAGVSFGLSPMFTDLALQQNVVDAAAWSGVLLGALERGRWRLLAGALAMSLLAASPETTLWQLFLCGALVWQRRAPLARPVASAGLGFGVAALMLFPALEFTRLSIRGHEDMDSGAWSMSWRQLVAAFWPIFDLPYGEYWGDDQRFVVNVFLGTLTVALAAWGAVRGPRVARVFSGGAVALALFSLGRHLPPVAWLLGLPPFNLFRYPAKAYVGVAFCVAVLAGFGLPAAVRAARRWQPPRWWAFVALAGVALIWRVSIPVMAMLPLRASAPTGAPWLWFVAGAVVVGFFALPRGPRRTRVWGATLAALCVLELMLSQVVLVMAQFRPQRRLEAPSAAVAALPARVEGRVNAAVEGTADTFPADAGDIIVLSRDLLVANRFMEERLETVNGYGAPEPRRAERLSDGRTRGFLDLAGVTHHLSENGAPPFADARRLAELPGGVVLYATDTALPRAFVVQRSVIADDEAALRAIEDESLGQPFRHTAFLAEGPVLSGTPCESEVTREGDGLRTAGYRVRACDDGLLVMTDSFFPGWRVWVDGEEKPLLRADYTFRAVALSRGEHEVRLRYWPASFTWGLVVSVLSALSLALPWFRRSRSGAARSASASAR